MNTSPLHVWAIIRLLPKMQRVVIQRFRRRNDAESYLCILRRYVHDARFLIIFDPPSSTTNPEAHSKNCEKSGTSPPSSIRAPND